MGLNACAIVGRESRKGRRREVIRYFDSATFAHTVLCRHQNVSCTTVSRHPLLFSCLTDSNRPPTFSAREDVARVGHLVSLSHERRQIVANMESGPSPSQRSVESLTAVRVLLS